MRHQGWLQLLMTITVVLVSLWMLYLLSWPRRGWSPTYSLSNSWLEYTDDDGVPEKVCNCSAILQGERERLWIRPNEFRLRRKYLMFPLSQEEEDFPLAYSIVVHHKVQNFERLLRAIYAPQNIYCVHVDKKSDVSVFAAMQAITSCFPNVFMVSKPLSVVYGHWSRVQADINCMADLYNISTEWKYLMNLCGQDFPLKTNLEIVRMLRSLRGGNSLESKRMAEDQKWRVTNVHEITDGKIQTTSKKKEPPPVNLPILTGNAYIVVSRGYIRSVLEDNRIPALIEWSKDTFAPEEFFYATIQRLPGVPGSTRPNLKYDMTDLNAIARLGEVGGP
ncbi:Beta-1 [Nibea albiflora]|uniref:Beta-1 n=1 Tax=Nibea albiflora TaxID=240163 RepID=A0ACB7FCN6_NIBAL|nr:Beta-1 [Nibea albiflora]